MLTPPFEREVDYSLAALRTYEAAVQTRADASAEFGKALRAPTGKFAPPAKLRADELLPLLLFANSRNEPDDTLFRIMKQGHAIDAQLKAASVLNIQITIAFVDHGGGDGGYQQRLKAEAVNQDGWAAGSARYKRDGKQVMRVGRMMSTAAGNRKAFEKGIIQAINKKAKFAGQGSTLVVFIPGFLKSLTGCDLADVASDVSATVAGTSFDETWLVSQHGVALLGS